MCTMALYAALGTMLDASSANDGGLCIRAVKGMHCPQRKQLPTTDCCASRGNRHLPLDLLQDHVVCGKVGRFAEVAAAKVLLI